MYKSTPFYNCLQDINPVACGSLEGKSYISV